MGLQQFGSNKDTEAPGVYALRGSNAGQWVHRDGRAEKPNEATRVQRQQETATTLDQRARGRGGGPEAQGLGIAPRPWGKAAAVRETSGVRDGEKTSSLLPAPPTG